MATYKAQIEDYIGSFSDTSALDAWLTHAARLIVHLMPDNKAEKFTKTLTDGGSGISIEDYRPLWAHKSGYRAIKFPADMKARLSLSGSIYKATATSPAWYIELLKAYIVPSGGSVVVVPLPTVVNTMSSITLFPNEYKHGIVLYAAIQGLIQLLNTLSQTTLGGITFSSGTAPTTPPAPTFVYSDGSATSITSTSITFSDTLAYTQPTFGGSFANIDSALGNADVELARGHASQLQVHLENYSKDLQNNWSVFQKDKGEYDGTLQKAIEDARLTQQRLIEAARLGTDVSLQNKAKSLEAKVGEYVNKLQKFQTDISSYAAQVQEEIQRITTLTQKHLGQHGAMQTQLASMKEEYNQILEMVKRG